MWMTSSIGWETLYPLSRQNDAPSGSWEPEVRIWEIEKPAPVGSRATLPLASVAVRNPRSGRVVDDPGLTQFRASGYRIAPLLAVRKDAGYDVVAAFWSSDSGTGSPCSGAIVFTSSFN